MVKIGLTLITFSLSACIAMAQSNSEVLKALLESDGPQALLLLDDQSEAQLESETLGYISDAWHLIGDEAKERHYAGLALKNAADDQKALFRAHLLFAEGKWSLAASTYNELAPDGKNLQSIRKEIEAIVLSNLDGAQSLKRVENLLNQIGNPDQPVFKVLRSQALRKANQLEQAMDVLESITVAATNPYLLIEKTFEMGEVHLARQDRDQAFDFFSQAQDLSAEINHNKVRAASLYLMSRIRAIQGKFDEALKLAERGSSLARMLGNRWFEYKNNNIISWSYFSLGTQFSTILKHEHRQAELVSFLNDETAKADAYNNLGYDGTIAGITHLDSLTKMMHIANDTYARQAANEGRWYTLMNLNWLYRLKAEYALSEEQAKKSLAQARAEMDRHAIIEAAFQYGETLLALERVAEAGPYYDEGLKQRGSEEDRDAYVFDVYYANYLWVAGKGTEAIQRLESAIKFLSTSEVFFEMHGRALLASFYFETGEIAKAKEQVRVFETPRSDYIAFETRCIVAKTQSRILSSEGQNEKAISLLQNYKVQAKRIGAEQLVQMLGQTINGLSR